MIGTIEHLTTIDCPHCYVHVFDLLVPGEGVAGLEYRPGYQVTVQVPEDYQPTRLYRCRFMPGKSCCSQGHEGSSELHRPSGWDRHSGYLWFDTAVNGDLKEAFKELLIELAVTGWWELAEEIHEHSQCLSARRCEA